jgi:hypothetical protein
MPNKSPENKTKRARERNYEEIIKEQPLIFPI